MTVRCISDSYLDVFFKLLSGSIGAQAEALLEKHGAPAIPRMKINAYVRVSLE